MYKNICALSRNLNSRNLDQYTPLYYASIDYNTRAVYYLLLQGADKNCEDEDGLTPFDNAISYRNYVTCALLAAFKCKTNNKKWNHDLIFEKVSQEELFGADD